MDISIKQFAIIIFVITCSFTSKADIVSVEISKINQQNKIAVKYEFENPISALTFKNSPEGFIKDHWQLGSGKLAIKVSDKTIHLANPSKDVSFIVSDGFDTSEMRAYSPYLFMTTQTAIFLDYFLPQQITYTALKHSQEKTTFDITLRLEKDHTKTFTANSDGLGKYIFVDVVNSEQQTDKFTSFFISTELPVEFKQTMTSSVKTLLNYFKQYFEVALSRPIDVIVTYNKKKDYIGFEGSALSGQIILELSGENLLTEPKQFNTFILHTLTHEAAHLWNGYIWSQVPDSPTWLYEGSADHLAYEALLQLKLIPDKHYDYFYQAQLKECKNILKEKALNNIDNTPYFNGAYSCGRIIFNKLEQILKREQGNETKILQKFYSSSENKLYSINTLLALFENKQVRDFIHLISSSDKDALKAFEDLMAL